MPGTSKPDHALAVHELDLRAGVGQDFRRLQADMVARIVEDKNPRDSLDIA